MFFWFIFWQFDPHNMSVAGTASTHTFCAFFLAEDEKI